MVILQPVFGHLSDKIGRKPLLIFFGVGGTVLTVPFFTLLTNATQAWQAFLLMLVGVVIVSGYTSINAIVKAELFPVEIRALGVGLPYGLTVPSSGELLTTSPSGCAPFTWKVASSGTFPAPSLSHSWFTSS